MADDENLMCIGSVTYPAVAIALALAHASYPLRSLWPGMDNKD